MAGDAWLRDALEDVQRRGQWRSLERRMVQARTERTVTIGGRERVCFASNDYLGLAAHSGVKAAAARAALEDAGGSGASRHISGNSGVHVAFETDVAAFMRAEAALLFGSGFLANVGIIRALVGPGDHVFSDELNHASLIDGCRQSRAHVHVYRHGDLEHLASLMAVHTGGRKLVVTDGVFSMDGDVAPLRGLCDLADAHDAMTLVDEAHALGIMGEGGRGACAQHGVEHRVTVRMGTLGKALGSYGAFAVGSRAVVDWLVNTARTLIFSTALPPSCSAAGMEALRLVREGTLPARLQHLQARMMVRMRARGLDGLLPAALRDLAAFPTPIVPVLLGDNARALRVARAMEERGWLCVGIRPPTVPEGTARLRITLSAGHRDEDVDGVVDALADVLAAEHRGAAELSP